MNASTIKVLREYAIVAIIGFVFYLSMFIIGIPHNGISLDVVIYSIFSMVLGALYFVGWYQFLIVEVLGFEGFSFQSFGTVLSRIADVISRNLHNNLVWVIIKFVIWLFLGAFIGIAKAILRIKRSLNE